MKVTIYSLVTLVLFIIVPSPVSLKGSTKNEIEESRVITYTRNKLKRLVKTVEYNQKADSISIADLKKKY